MKKYPITFTSDYILFEKWANEGNPIAKQKIDNNPMKLSIQKIWQGKKITILELEQFIDEFELVVFNGETIEIYNDYRG